MHVFQMATKVRHISQYVGVLLLALIVKFLGLVYVHGGGSEKAVFGDLFEFNVETEEWTCLYTPSGTDTGNVEPAARNMHSMAYWKDKLYIWGGAGLDNVPCDTKLWSFDLGSKTWQATATSGDSPGPRFSQVAQCLSVSGKEDEDDASGKWLFFGGMETNQVQNGAIKTSNDLFILNLSSGTWHQQITGSHCPSPRSGCTHGLLTLNNTQALLVYGGLSGSECLYDAFVYWIDREVWEEVEQRGQIPGPRCAAASGGMRGNMLLAVGGASTAAVFDTVHVGMLLPPS